MSPHQFTAAEAAPLVYFANERHAVYMRKAIIQQSAELGQWRLSERGQAAWMGLPGTQGNIGDGPERWGLAYLTDDPILRDYRFCNVFRELDRVTVWIRQNIREPFAESEHLWFMLSAGRFINWPDTLGEIINQPGAWPSWENFDLRFLTMCLEARRGRGDKVETGAYMIRAESDPKKEWYSWSKQRYVSEIVLGRPWAMRDAVRDFLEVDKPTLEETWTFLTDARSEADWVGWGPFMAGQIVADLRHTRYLRDAQDVGRWAPLGPGSTRGLNRLAGRPLKQSIGQSQGLTEMLQLRDIVNSSTEVWVPPIELHDIQNCLCETDKYLRVKTGEGRPRAQYVPGRGH